MSWKFSQQFRSSPSGRRRHRGLALETLEDRTLLSVFTLPLSVSTGVSSSPESVAVGDFNGNGKPDVAVANNGTHTVSILMNNGNGTFQPPVNYNVNSNPTEIISADLNNDGKPDLIVVNSNAPGAVTVLLGNGNGTFANPVAYAVGNNPSGVVAVDLRNNGFLDLVVTNKTDNTISVLLNNGHGAFGPASTVSVPASPVSITSGDFGNGNQDVAIVANSQVVVLYGNGNGTFAATQATFSAGPGPGFIVSGDFNKDGKPDLAVANVFPDNNGLAVLINNGSGAFASPVFYSLGALPDTAGGPTSNLIAVGDLNGDGNLDIVTADGAFANNDVSVLLGNGDGTFGRLTNWVANQQPVGIAIGDFNADHKPDLVVANLASNDVSFLTGNGDGTFRAPHVYANISSPGPVVTGDFNGDGKQDIIIGNTASLTGVILTEMLGNGDGTFQPATTINANVATPALGQAVALAAADLNGDHKLDLVMLDGNHNVDVFLGNGDGTFQAPAVYAGGANSNALALGDFTGNGRTDIVVLNSPTSGNGSVNILLNNGNGAFSAFATAANAGITPSAIAAADVNGDGKADLVIGNRNGFSSTVSILTSNGDGTFKAPVSYSLDGDPTAIAVGDLNGDGSPDLAVTTFLGKGLDVYLNNGNGTFSIPRFYQTGSNSTGVLIGDFMNEGHADVLTTDDFGDSLTLWTNPGTGFLVSALTFAVGDRPAMSAAADFNRDGLLDVVTTDSNASSVAVLLRANPFPQLAPPSPLLQVANALTHSREHYVDFVTNAYITYLGRPPAPTGLNTWVSAMQNGLTDEQLEAQFIATPEYINNHGGLGAGWITAMYQNLLGRTPSQTEVNKWLTALHNGATPEQIAFGFAASAERESDRVVADYQIFLGRTPAPSEVSRWVAAFSNGLTNESLVAGFLGSAEYYNDPAKGKGDNLDWIKSAFQDELQRAPTATEINGLEAALLPPNLSTIANQITHSTQWFQLFVTNAFEQYLGRPPSLTGLNNWVRQMETGLTDEQLEAALIGSSEYINNHGGPGAGWVTGMYQDLLGRSPSQTEVNFWVNALNHGTTPQQVAFDFAASAEREGIRVRADYQTFLGRSPTQTEVDLWVKAFGNGMTNEDVVAGFLASAEYFNSSTKGKSDKSDWTLSAIRDVLGRLARTSEFDFWGGNLQ
jgi:hypothetical protein